MTQTVKGKVTDAKRTKTGILLSLGNNREMSFRVVIFNNSLNSFYAKHINPLDFYKEKVIEISARIRAYKQTAQAVVSSPLEISMYREKV